MDNITASEIAGFGVGTLLLCATIAAPKVDALISASQRSSLGMCRNCGDLRMIACSKCKGIGSIRKGGFGVSFINDFFDSLGDSNRTMQSVPCIYCQSEGRIRCPNCSSSIKHK